MKQRKWKEVNVKPGKGGTVNSYMHERAKKINIFDIGTSRDIGIDISGKGGRNSICFFIKAKRAKKLAKAINKLARRASK